MAYRGIIHVCTHCSNRVVGTGRFCSDCTTAEKRREQDENNRKLFEENNLPPYICRKCN